MKDAVNTFPVIDMNNTMEMDVTDYTFIFIVPNNNTYPGSVEFSFALTALSVGSSNGTALGGLKDTNSGAFIGILVRIVVNN